MHSTQIVAALREIDPLLRRGDYPAARDALRSVVGRYPASAEALRLLAGVEQALGELDAAEALLRRAVSADPGWAPAVAALGELLLARGNDAEAEPLLQRASQRLAQAALALARHYMANQRAAAAAALLTPHVGHAGVHAELAALHVNALASIGRSADALAHYRKLVETQPNDAAARHALALALAADRQHAQARREVERAIAGGQRNAQARLTQARSLVALGEYAGAEAALRDAVRLQPRFVEAHDHLARLIWMQGGDLADATAVLDDALRGAPDEPALLAAKAAVLQGAGDARAAFACLEALAARPAAPPALLVRAAMAALEFDADAARLLAERALAAAPASQPARSLVAAALLGSGDAAAALPHCEVLRAAQPDDQYLIALQTTAWRLLGDARYAAWCDYATRVVPCTLPTPAGWSSLPAFLADLKASLERVHAPLRRALLFQSLRNGTETTEDLTFHDDATIRALFGAFAEPIRAYIHALGKGDDPLRRRHSPRWRFNGSWSVRLRDAGYHQHHVHPRGWLSSAFYVDLPDAVTDDSDDAGALTFGVPSFPTRPALAVEHRVRPQAGQLVLFPSYFWHGTVPFAMPAHGTQARLTVAFDVVPQ